MQGAILLVEDDPDAREVLTAALTRRGFAVHSVGSGADALTSLRDTDFDIIVTDVRLGGMTGIELCQRASELRPNVPAIVMTGHADLDTAIAAMRAGAFDFIEKPVVSEALALMLHRAIHHRRLTSDIIRLREQVSAVRTSSIVGDSPAMQRLARLVDQVAPSEATVLITGESGTGKELIARALHERSARAAGPFVAINCGAISPNLLESELFGHVRGSFTDARQDRPGVFAKAAGGTLLLDEIGDTPLEMQAKLLRVLQERRVRPVGSDTEVPIDVRVVAATHKDLTKEVSEGRFRADLFYRINVLRLDVPPLRTRREDVLVLAQAFLARQARPGTAPAQLSPEAARRLLDYDWPGNVRELENCIERASVLSKGREIGVEDMPGPVQRCKPVRAIEVVAESTDLVTLDEMERQYIRTVLHSCRGNKSQAARVLGIDRRALYRRIESLQIE
jgi:DNA-binding NtrC family response regulator